MIFRRGSTVYRRFAEGSCIFILVIVRICDENLALVTRLRGESEAGAAERDKLGELTDLALVEDLTSWSSRSMSTSMGSLVGGVSLMLLSRSDDKEPHAACERTGFDDTGSAGELDANVGAQVGFVSLALGLPKKFMRLFCFMFSDETRFSGTF